MNWWWMHVHQLCRIIGHRPGRRRRDFCARCGEWLG